MPSIPSGPIRAPIAGTIDLAESVAGEEDPGASIDLALGAAPPARHADQAAGQRAGPPPPMSPGDEAPAGTPGTGEDVCPKCGGSGTVDGAACPQCEGTGKVTVGIGGA